MIQQIDRSSPQALGAWYTCTGTGKQQTGHRYWKTEWAALGEIRGGESLYAPCEPGGDCGHTWVGYRPGEARTFRRWDGQEPRAGQTQPGYTVEALPYSRTMIADKVARTAE